MTDPTVEMMVQLFARRQMDQVLLNGSSIGLAPVTTAATMMQIAAAFLVQTSSSGAVALLRAYADCIEAGPGTGKRQDAARAHFNQVAQEFMSAAQASRDFPQPQGRA